MIANTASRITEIPFIMLRSTGLRDGGFPRFLPLHFSAICIPMAGEQALHDPATLPDAGWAISLLVYLCAAGPIPEYAQLVNSAGKRLSGNRVEQAIKDWNRAPPPGTMTF